MATTSPRRRLTSTAPLAIGPADLPRMSQEELDALFSRSPAGPTPSGVGDRYCDRRPRDAGRCGVGGADPPRLAREGLYAEQADLLNRVGPFGLLVARARVYRDASWMDGHEAIVLDYSVGSLPFRAIRDEIREVAPGLYLGVVYWVGAKTINFSLRFRQA